MDASSNVYIDISQRFTGVDSCPISNYTITKVINGNTNLEILQSVYDSMFQMN